MHAQLLQLCLTLCDPTDHSLHAPLSMGVSRQKYWSGLLCPPPGDLPNPGMGLKFLMSWEVYSLPLVPPGWHPPLSYLLGLRMLILKCGGKKKLNNFGKETKDFMPIKKIDYEIRIRVTTLRLVLGTSPYNTKFQIALNKC